MTVINAKDKAIKQYYTKRQELDNQGAVTEMTVREAFKALLETTAKANKWTLLVEHKLQGKRATPDGTLNNSVNYPVGYWEAKDTKDNLEVEITKKFEKGYPKKNIIFEDTRIAILYQNGQRAGQFALSNAEEVADLLTRFLSYSDPYIEDFDQAVEHFKEITPQLSAGLLKLIDEAHNNNKEFQDAFDKFYKLCESALNPNIKTAAVDEMLIQHLLTERLMRTVFGNPDFNRRNAIAIEVEKVIDALTSNSFSREAYIGQLSYFYEAIEGAAKGLKDFSERQKFMNTIYERFFQGYAVKVADTHGIVYTPQPIVDFMCAAVEEVLLTEFDKRLADDDVYIIDPCTGTGNFIINLLHRIEKQDIAAFYSKRLFANEVMLLPYYVASLNIEHAYYELTGKYEPFAGLCFVDTLDLAEGLHGKQLDMFMTETNTVRVERQKKAPITVILGNPPYNVGQLNENDNNKNRKYKVIDKRVAETYAKDSKASSKSKLNDPYVKFFRWASDRLQGRDGIVCYVSNNSFIDQIAFDGMRKHLLKDFTQVYHLDLHGNVRQNPKLSGTTHNVFGIQVGVGITVAIQSAKHKSNSLSTSSTGGEGVKLLYHRVPEFWTGHDKLTYLTENVDLDTKQNSLNTVQWQELAPDNRHTWLVPKNANEYATYLPIGSKETKSGRISEEAAIFKIYSLGLNTNRDDWAYNFSKQNLATNIRNTIDVYNSEIDRWKRSMKPLDIDGFVINDPTKIKWSSRLKETLLREQYAEFSENKVRQGFYRPYTKQYLFFDSILNHRQGIFPHIFPSLITERENLVICVCGIGSNKPFHTIISNAIPCLDVLDKTQCFPFYTYNEDGTNRRENITDWALTHFHTHFKDDKISKWDIFYYVYSLLHNPTYRTKFADDLRRELPRIPFAPDFWAFSEAGKKLANLHLNYETIEPHKLKWVFAPDKHPNYRVEQMKFTKENDLVYNDTLTLKGIPAEAFDYKLGNRSALHWIVDQYQVSTDKRSGITSDPNTYSDDEQYIVKLVGRVTRVSIETVAIVNALPPI